MQYTQEKIKLITNEVRIELEKEAIINEVKDKIKEFLVKGDFIRFIREGALLLIDLDKKLKNCVINFGLFDFEDKELTTLYLLMSKFKQFYLLYFTHLEDVFFDKIRCFVDLVNNFLRSKNINFSTIKTETISNFEIIFENNYFKEIFNIIVEDVKKLSALLDKEEKNSKKWNFSWIEEQGLFFYITPLSLLHLKGRAHIFETYASVEVKSKEELARTVEIFAEILVWKENIIGELFRTNNPSLEQSFFSIEAAHDPQGVIGPEASIFSCLRFMFADINKLKQFFLDITKEESFNNIIASYNKGALQNRKATFDFITSIVAHVRSEQDAPHFSELLLVFHHLAMALAQDLDENKKIVKGTKSGLARYFVVGTRCAFGFSTKEVMKLSKKELSDNLKFIGRILFLQAFIIDPVQQKSFKIAFIVELIHFTIEREHEVNNKEEKRDRVYNLILDLIKANASADYVELFKSINTHVSLFRRLGKSKKSTQAEEMILKLRDAMVERIVTQEFAADGVEFSLEQLLKIFAKITDESDVSTRAGDLIRYIIQQSPGYDKIYALYDALIKNVFNPPKKKNGQKVDIKKYISDRSNILAKAIAELYRIHRAKNVPVPASLHLFAALLNYTISEFIIKNPQEAFKLYIVNANYIHLPSVTPDDLQREQSELYRKIVTEHKVQNAWPSQSDEDDLIEIQLVNKNIATVSSRQVTIEKHDHQYHNMSKELLPFVILLDDVVAHIMAQEYVLALRQFANLLIILLEKIKNNRNNEQPITKVEIELLLDEVVFYSKNAPTALDLALQLYHCAINQINLPDSSSQYWLFYKTFLAALRSIFSYKKYYQCLSNKSYQVYTEYKKKEAELSLKIAIESTGMASVKNINEFNYQFYSNYFEWLIKDLESLVNCDEEKMAESRINELVYSVDLSLKFFYCNNYTVNYLLLHCIEFDNFVKNYKNKKFSINFYLTSLITLLKKMSFFTLEDVKTRDVMVYIEEGKYREMLENSCKSSNSVFLNILRSYGNTKNRANEVKLELFEDLVRRLSGNELGNKQKLYKFLLVLNIYLSAIGEQEKAEFGKNINKSRLALIKATNSLYGMSNVREISGSNKVQQEMSRLTDIINNEARFLGGADWFKDEKRARELKSFVLFLFNSENDKNQGLIRKCFNLVLDIILINDGRYEQVFKSMIQDVNAMSEFGVEIMKLKQSLSAVEFTMPPARNNQLAQSMGQLMQGISQSVQMMPVNDNCHLPQ